jgi:hypothetical protein
MKYLFPIKNYINNLIINENENENEVCVFNKKKKCEPALLDIVPNQFNISYSKNKIAEYLKEEKKETK